MYSHETTQYKAIVEAFNEFSGKLFSIVEDSQSMDDVFQAAETIEHLVDMECLIEEITTTEYEIVRKPYETKSKMVPVLH